MMVRMQTPLEFSIEKRLPDRLGRAGHLTTSHGAIRTPAFVPVGTKATVKGILPEQLSSLGAQVVLANTYHLYLQPGEKLVQKFGGLGKFMDWPGPTITDSGGFQAFSLGAAFGKGISKVTKITDPSLLIPERSIDFEEGKLAKIGADGVSFTSHLDGSSHYFTPEKSIDIQHAIGADIIFAFDECTSPSEDRRYQEEALERTHRWAKRSLDFHLSKDNSRYQALFGIVQGGRDKELRQKSAKTISEMHFDGFGIGGSFAKEDMMSAVEWVNEILPEEKPRHLLGIGEPEDLFMGVERGVDLFDCVLPTRNGRNGTLYTHEGKINIRNAKFTDDQSPIDSQCDCEVCKKWTRGYIAHLYRADEMLGSILGTIHNLRFIISLVDKMRQAILDGNFDEFKKDFLSRYQK